MNGATESFQTVVIGGSQAGLSVGYHLARQGQAFVILDENERIGDAWRNRWDSLRIFSPAFVSGLPGFPFPGPAWYFPTKDELADYFEAYAARFELPVRRGTRVTRVSAMGERFVVEAGDRRLEADNVVVATGHDHTPKVPPFARDLDPRILQIHSSEYRRPSQLRPGSVLLVGAGNSGAEISLEASRTHHTFLSGRLRRAPVGPSRSRPLTTVLWPIVNHVLTIDTPIGRKVRRKMLKVHAPVERVKRQHLVAAGVELVPRAAGVQGGSPVLEDGRVLEVANVIWCTGFRPGLDWIDLPVFDEDGAPQQTRGVVEAVPGLYFVGRFFQYAFSSSFIGGVGRDAGYVTRKIAARAAASERAKSAAMITAG
ncbi:MAG: flavin-containing monooxygenase [Candidatus Limnocylindria bacterium]